MRRSEQTVRSGRYPGVVPVIFALTLLLSISIDGIAGSLRKGLQYNITFYGAIGDAKTMSTGAIQKAIDACAAAGGGTVLIPSGEFVTGSLTLKSKVHLHLVRGAMLVGSRELEDYTDGVLILARDAKDASIDGDGVINGSGRHFWDSDRHPLSRPDGLIKFVGCEGISVKSVRLINSPKFTVVIDDCRRVSVDGVTIRNSLDSPNTDGIDVVNSSDVVISGSSIETGDDAVCLKSTKHHGIVERVTVRNCKLVSDDTALKLGTGSRNRISDCVFSDIVIPEATNCIGLFMKDGGTFERIRFDGIKMTSVRVPMKKYLPKGGGAAYWKRVLRNRQTFPIFVDSESRSEGVPAGNIRDVVFRNIDMTTYGGNCLIQGRTGRPLQDISLINIRYRVVSEQSYCGRTKPRGTHSLPGRSPNDFADIPSYLTFACADGLTIRNVSVIVAKTAAEFPMHFIWGNELRDCIIDSCELIEPPGLRSIPAMNFIKTENLSLTEFYRRHSDEAMSAGSTDNRQRMNGEQLHSKSD